MSTPSPTLDPGVLAPLAPDFQIGQNDAGPVYDAAFTSVAASMHTIHDSARLLGEAVDSVTQARDPGAQRRLHAAATARLNTARRGVEAATNAIDSRRAQLEAEIDVDLMLPQHKAGVVENIVANDVRGRLRQLGGGSRAFDAVREAIANNDPPGVAAVLAASPLASGLGYDQHRMLRSMAEQAFSPKRVAMRAGLEKLSAVVARAGDVLNAEYGYLLGEGDGRDARKERALRALETNGGQG
jgi:hypothetical protein